MLGHFLAPRQINLADKRPLREVGMDDWIDVMGDVAQQSIAGDRNHPLAVELGRDMPLPGAEIEHRAQREALDDVFHN